MTFQPLFDQVLVRRAKAQNVSPSGLIMSASDNEKLPEGEVLAVGSGRILNDGTQRPPAVAAGDRVVFGKYAGESVMLGDEELIVMREDSILGIVRP